VDLDHDIVIQAVADTPSIFVHDADPVSEDGNNVSVRITVPKDPSQVIGTIVGIMTETATLVEQDDGVYLITAEGPTPAARQEYINSFVADGGLPFNPSRPNWAGSSTLKVEAISTEDADGSKLAVFVGNRDKSPMITSFSIRLLAHSLSKTAVSVIATL
jgi:hypothetical protein